MQPSFRKDIQLAENEEKNGRPGIQVIARAAAILRVVKEAETGLSLGQISGKVGLARSTVQRITSALVTESFLIPDPKGRGLRLGPAISALASAAQYNIVEHCRLLLTELTQKTGETADLSTIRGAGMVFLDQVPGLHRLTTVSRVGEVFPLTTTANGRACLAQLPEEDARKLIQNELDRNVDAGKMDSLLQNLNDIRVTGLAYDLDEHSPGISAIGFAFRDWGGELHAISVPLPSTRFEKKRELIETALRETSASIEDMFD